MSAQWSALKAVVDGVNASKNPYEDFSALMVFVLSSVKGLDGSQLSDAVQAAFLYVESQGLSSFSNGD